MKKVLVILALLVVTGIASADLVVDGATWAPTNGWMNVTEPGGGGWGSGWGLPDVRTTGTAGNILLQTNVNASDDNYAAWSGGTDLYWLPGNNIMEGLSYTETWGLAGQNVTFNFVVGSNNLAGALDAAGNPIVTEAFIKTLNPDAGWATVQQVYASLPVGAGSVSLLIDTLTNPVVQIGFRVVSGNDVSGSATADAGVTIVPEPATMALLGIGGLFLRRRK